MADLALLLEKVYSATRSAPRIVRSDDSRSSVEVVEEGEAVGRGGWELVTLEGPKKSADVMALDSSSRALDTPYLFISVGAASAVDRHRWVVVDYPDPGHVMSQQGDLSFVLMAPEVSPFDYGILEEAGVTYRDPGGEPYTPDYSRPLMLEEFRLALENRVLGLLLEREAPDALFVDGPLFLPLKLSGRAPGPGEGALSRYTANWNKVMRERVGLLKKLGRLTRVVGVVKRLQMSTVLSKFDPLGLGAERMSDLAYMSVLADRLFQERESAPIALGPFFVKQQLGGDVLEKALWYLAVPKFAFGGWYRGYAFFRIEVMGPSDGSEELELVLGDTVGSGSALPLSILLADSRVKRYTSGLARYFLAAAGLSRESTLQYITPQW